MVDQITELLNNTKNKPISIKLRNDVVVKGILLDFDPTMNLTLDDAEYILEEKPVKVGKILLRGNNIQVLITPES
ncbi:MAG: ribonucleoprotein [Nitrosopumilaceae archaeon]|nr:ribonucleoprotein [Nitrosopumilaceae archaeon]NIU87050.1 ribonucleoprotein [Nitrosopumilaceae archaeon]NIV65705.1 ribonucleoprotein [Nitrosopumilaceae archaeon]NIX61353.1 ribonucleoprotein [Nitrosopumilaceae archaeon]